MRPDNLPKIQDLTLNLLNHTKAVGPQALRIPTVGSSQVRQGAYSLSMLTAFEF